MHYPGNIAVDTRDCLLGEIFLDKHWKVGMTDMLSKTIEVLGIVWSWKTVIQESLAPIGLQRQKQMTNQVFEQGTPHYGSPLHLLPQIDHHHHWMDPFAESVAAMLESSEVLQQ